jgi:AcrR family transcriptional regulator
VRADAVRNANAILEAAREVVAERGIDAPMAVIAERAGVAVGTLYRHHPSKEHLVAAVVEDSTRKVVVALETALDRVRGGAAVGAQLEAVLLTAAETYAADRAFKEGAHRPPDDPPAARQAPDDALARRGWAALTALLERAQTAGAVRADVAVDDVVAILAAVPGSSARRERYLAVMLAGLRPET